MTGVLALMSCFIMGSRSFSEAFVSFWSAAMLLGLSIGGTMIMRKFHNSMAVGFFMGGIVGMAQFTTIEYHCITESNLRLADSTSYAGYKKDLRMEGYSGAQEGFMSLLCLMECALLASFAAILGAHRSEIMDKNPSDREDYQTPYVAS
eukprot:scaffold9857_cov127-Cylindrotheca_fusiformis.AAC.16